VNFSTGQLGGFFGVFFRMFLFWALYWIQEVLHGIKPAYLELFGLRIGMGNRVTMSGVFSEQRGLFWITMLTLSIPGVHPLIYQIT
jgi:hypothetical protein